MLIHAYLYDQTGQTHTLNNFGQKAEFKPNQAGHVVCEVEEGPLLVRLLQIPEGYRLYNPKAEPVKVAAVVAPTAPLEPEAGKSIITNDATGESIDLEQLDRAGLVLLIEKLGLDYEPHHKTGAASMRKTIMELMSAAQAS